MSIEESSLKKSEEDAKETNEESNKSPELNQTSDTVNPQVSKFFKCYLCSLQARYEYYGTRPLDRFLLKNESTQEKLPQRKENIILFEKSFVCDDPFSSLKSSNFLILGALCSQCDKMVCMSNECSFFYYNKRFCLSCAKIYMGPDTEEFPVELKTEISKILASKSK